MNTFLSRPVSLAAAAVLAACAGYPAPARLLDPPAGRELVRSIAVVVEETPCAPQVQRPMGVCGAMSRGVLFGVGTGFGAAAVAAGPLAEAELPAAAILLWLVVSAVTVPVCTVGGAVLGARDAMPADEVAWRVGIVERALLAGSPAIGLGSAMPASVRAARPRLRRVDPASADAVLTVRPVRLGLLGSGGLDPMVAVVVEVEALWDAQDVTHRQRWQYRGPSRPLTLWSTESARIAEELRLAREELSTRIAEELLLVEVK